MKFHKQSIRGAPLDDIDPRWKTAILATGLIVVAALGLTPLIAVFRLGTDLAAWWVVLAFQFVITALGCIVSIAVAYYFAQYLVLSATEKAVEKIDSLRLQHEELVKKVALRAPTFAVGMLLVSQAMLYLADKSFKDNIASTVSVSLVLVIAFWIANEFCTRESRSQRRLGICLWCGAVFFLPMMVVLDRNGDIYRVWQEFQALGLPLKSVTILTLLAGMLAPFAFVEQFSNGAAK